MQSQSERSLFESEVSESEIIALFSLCQHPGWTVLAKLLKDVREHEVISVMDNTAIKDADHWHKAQGVCWTCKQFINLPEQVDNAMADLEDEKKAQQNQV